MSKYIVNDLEICSIISPGTDNTIGRVRLILDSLKINYETGVADDGTPAVRLNPPIRRKVVEQIVSFDNALDKLFR